MHTLASALSLDMQRLVFIAICLFGVVFLIWFFVALVIEKKKMLKKRRSSAGRKRTFVEPIPIDSAHIAAHLECSRPSQVNVLRLSDKNIDQKTTKLRWLLMALLLSTSFRLSAQTQSSSQTTQTQPVPPSTQSASAPTSN